MKTFKDLNLSSTILSRLSDLGYEEPTPIQEQSIPLLLEGKDMLGQAQTGTGKTAAFALPILSRIDLTQKNPQALVLAPTRELAIQVAEAFQSYAKNLNGFHVLPIYGGQSYQPQLKALNRGVHVVVGTPGRVMDHLRRKSLSIKDLKTIVLDEADEMLKMGFIDDVKWILEQISGDHQTVLFSATIPTSIKRVAEQHLNNPVKVQIKSKESTVSTIEQCYMLLSKNAYKLEALTRFLEIEPVDACIIFTRTKIASAELAEKLEARGYAVAAINGDISQDMREKVIKRIKKGSLDIVVATDVAARGIDVERISHVVNYDIPHDAESYIHRIGRTGRAGRQGKALLLVTPREQRMLRDIERHTRKDIAMIKPPSVAQINDKRLEAFTSEIVTTLKNENLDKHRELIESIVHDSESSELDVAAALAHLAQKKKPVQKDHHDNLHSERDARPERSRRGDSRRDGFKRDEGKRDGGRGRRDDSDMVKCRIALGREQGVSPSDIVGVIANKANINRQGIGRIEIRDDYSFVDLSDKIIKKVIDKVYSLKLKGHQTMITPVKGAKSPKRSSDSKKPMKKHKRR